MILLVLYLEALYHLVEYLLDCTRLYLFPVLLVAVDAVGRLFELPDHQTAPHDMCSRYHDLLENDHFLIARVAHAHSPGTHGLFFGFCAGHSSRRGT